jgi:hypothetical protein
MNCRREKQAGYAFNLAPPCVLVPRVRRGNGGLRDTRLVVVLDREVPHPWSRSRRGQGGPKISSSLPSITGGGRSSSRNRVTSGRGCR